MDQQPGQNERGDRQTEVQRFGPTFERLHIAHHQADGDEARACGCRYEEEDDVRGLIIAAGTPARQLRVGVNDCQPAQDQVGAAFQVTSTRFATGTAVGPIA